MFQFFSDVKTELQKVVWPSRQETIRYTLVVIFFSLGVAAVLGTADYVLLKVFAAILK